MPMIGTDPSQDDNSIIFCNAAFQKLTGYSNADHIGRNCQLLQRAETDRAAVSRIREAISTGSLRSILSSRSSVTTFA